MEIEQPETKKISNEGLSEEEIIEKADAKKAQGNEAFKSRFED